MSMITTSSPRGSGRLRSAVHSTMLRALCLGLAVLLGVALTANGIFMLVSPEYWYVRCPVSRPPVPSTSTSCAISD